MSTNLMLILSKTSCRLTMLKLGFATKAYGVALLNHFIKIFNEVGYKIQVLASI